jgi:hypothetical protein
MDVFDRKALKKRAFDLKRQFTRNVPLGADYKLRGGTVSFESAVLCT